VTGGEGEDRGVGRGGVREVVKEIEGEGEGEEERWKGRRWIYNSSGRGGREGPEQAGGVGKERGEKGGERRWRRGATVV